MATATVQVPPRSEEEKAAMEELRKELEANTIAKTKGDGKERVRTIGHIVNHTNRGDLRLKEKYSWGDGETDRYGTIIEKGWWVHYGHHGSLPIGSKGAFVYVDGDDSTARKWVVAFHLPANKVYVETGPVGDVDWNVVEFKLDHHSGSESEYEDKILGGLAKAKVYPEEGRVGTWFFN